MTLPDMLEQVRIVCRMRRLSRHTEECYSGWISRFAKRITAHTLRHSIADAIERTAREASKKLK